MERRNCNDGRHVVNVYFLLGRSLVFDLKLAERHISTQYRRDLESIG